MDNSNYEELLNRINNLEEDNRSLRLWQEEMTKVLKQMLSNFELQNEKMQNLQMYANINRFRIESMPYELRDEEYESPVFIPKIMGIEETRKEIIEKKRSISRFGDGEFGIMAGVGRWNFQGKSDVLADKLERVLAADDGIIIGLNRSFYGNLEDMDESDADGVRAYMRPAVRRFHCQFLDPERIYGNLLIHDIKTDNDIASIKRLWDKKDCVFIEGEHTGMGVGNDLFNNCHSIERIICPAENAVDRYDDIMKAALKQSRDKLILLALGPTATALAYDLYKEGYWAVDIGHIDLIYEKYIRNLANLQDVSISYKYCNWDEVGERRQIEEITDKTYLSQVVDRVC